MNYKTGACSCKCKPGFTGVACEVPGCLRSKNAAGILKECGGPLQGEVTRENGKCVCKCKAGWSGPACSKPKCKRNRETGRICNGNGQCVCQGKKCSCGCDKGYTGKGYTDI